ncbi:MAG TPA: 50S ribosomal protein L22 [Kiloniellaceae bacterium]|uniref:50S ribosomal protein L22 n=1 Tax=Pelagibius sp. TaxID=1931238 RepID=UPI00176C1EDE|nr:50S ribosomal protein L22 [Kiloniellaceae bacterium]HIP77119.1 50S ribosomal protein L22 [Kiloniellaceae bacterium]
MGKPKHPGRLSETEARTVVRNLRTSPQKLNLVAASIRGLSAEAALAELTFSKRRIANDVKKALQSAIANAENNHQLDVDRLYVSEASVGRSFVMKRFRARARGRAGRIMKPWSRLTVVVREREETA